MTFQPDGAISALPTGAITDQVFSPDGQTLYTARNGTITAYDVSTTSVTGSWSIGTQLGGIAISPDGHSILAVELSPSAISPSNTAPYVYELDLASGVSRSFDLPATGTYPVGYGDISFLSDGTALVAGQGQWQPLTILNLSTGAATTTPQAFEGPTLTSSPDGSHVLVSPLNISDAELFMYTAGSGITASHQMYADNISGFNEGVQAISPDGSLSVEGVSLAVYDSNLHLITKLSDRFSFGAAGLAFSPDGSKLYVLDNQSNEVFVLSTSSWDVLAGYPVGASVTGSSSPYNNQTAPATHYGNALLVSPDGTHLAVDTAVSVQLIDLTKAVSDSGTSGGNDTVIGDSAQNVLYGFDGNDTLDGRAGADTMYGGPGDDTYYVDNISDYVVEKTNEGNDTVYSSLAYYTLPANVETLALAAGGVTAFGNDQANHLVGNDSSNQLIGYNGDDTLVGNGGNDLLDGGAGNDTMQGGSGDDTYYVDSPADVVQEDAGNGTDKIIASVSYTLAANIENLELTPTSVPLTGHGNALDNVIIGNGAEDVLYGLGGNDTLIGAAGSQYLYGGSGADTLTGGSGQDFFVGTVAELNGDTITDFAVGDTIVFTDATLANFSAFVSGNTLTYTGGSIRLPSGIVGTLVAAAAAGGGVQLTVQPPSHDAANDFNGDGLSDVLWRSDAGQLTDWLAAGNGSFSPNGGNSFATVATSWHIAGAGDVNGDGRDDILWRNDDGRITDWIANANGGFAASTTFSTTVSTAWHVAGTGDFNGDGKDDIVWRNDNGTITDWLSNASGGFTASTTFSTTVATSWHVVGTADFNGDGRDDILWRNDSGQLTDWLRTDTGGFVSNVYSVYVPTNWTVAATGDFNGDGYSDVLWRSDTGQMTDWLGSSAGTLSSNGAASTYVPTNWQVVEVGDFNGDGKDDILWRSDTGQLTDWLGTATGAFTPNSANLSTFVATSWHVQDAHAHGLFA